MSSPGSVAVSIASGIQLVRQGIAHRLSLLGATVQEFAEASTALRAMGDTVPDIFVLDAEEPDLDWRALVGELRISRGSIHVVLFARALSVDDVADARALGVAAIILRPFREEEHMRRLADLLRSARFPRARRKMPRYHPEPESSSLVSLEGDLSAMCRVVDLSLIGVCLEEPVTELRGLPAESSSAAIRISTWGVRFAVVARITWREGRRVGLEFGAFRSGRQEFVEHMESLQRRTFGQGRIRGPW